MFSRRYSAVKWLKRYAIGCLIALFLGSCVESYKRPDHDVRIGAVVLVAVAWPVVVAMVCGSSAGEVLREMNQKKPE